MQVRIISKPSFIMPTEKKKASEYFSKARIQCLLGTEKGRGNLNRLDANQ
jgi:hypothetical protein